MKPYVWYFSPRGNYSAGPFTPSRERRLWTCPSPEGTLIAHEADGWLMFLGVVQSDGTVMCGEWPSDRPLKGPVADKWRRAAGF